MAILLAVCALYPWALTTSWNHASGGLGGGLGATGWSVTFHNAVNRPVLLLGFTAVGLWVLAAALWVGRSRLMTSIAIAVAVSLSVSSVAVSFDAPRARSTIAAALLRQIRIGESEAAVAAALGPPADLGVGTNPVSDESLPCVLYPGSAAQWGPSVALCFRHGLLAVKVT